MSLAWVQSAKPVSFLVYIGHGILKIGHRVISIAYVSWGSRDACLILISGGLSKS